jgi:hypothetical protein
MSEKGFDPDAAAFQPAAPQHPMQAGVGFNLKSKHCRVSELKRSSKILALVGSRETTKLLTRSVAESQYLTAPSPTERKLSEQERAQLQLGCEDVWLLLLQNTRAGAEEILVGVVGRLLFDLEEFFYPGGQLRDILGAAMLSTRDEAML